MKQTVLTNTAATPAEVEELLVESGLLYAINRFLLKPFNLAIATCYNEGEKLPFSMMLRVIPDDESGYNDFESLPKLLRTLREYKLDAYWSGLKIFKPNYIVTDKVRVFLDGKLMQRVSAFDTQGGWVECFDINMEKVLLMGKVDVEFKTQE